MKAPEGSIAMRFDVLLVDDHKIMRDGIKAILKHTEEFHVIGEAENGSDAVQMCRRSQALDHS